MKKAALTGLPLVFCAALICPISLAGESQLAREARRMLAENPDDTRTMNKAAKSLYKEGLHDEAVAVWRAMMKLRPAMAEPHFRVGLAYFDRVQNEQAVAEFRKAVELDPAYAEAHYHLGTAYHELDDAEGAIREYRAAIDHDPALPEANDSLGRVLLDKGRATEAVQAFRAELRLQPKAAPVYFNLGCALKETGDYDEAIRAFEDSIRYTSARDGQEEIEQALSMILETRSKKTRSLSPDLDEEPESGPTLGLSKL